MTYQPSLEIFNLVLIQIMEAMLGNVTPNLRRVALSFEDGSWNLYFTLAEGSEAERGAVYDIVASFEALQQLEAPLKLNVEISDTPLGKLPREHRVVYRRQE